MNNGQQPAFPQSPEKVPTNFPISGGLTKREYFSVMALQGLIASCSHPMSIGSNLESYPKLPKEAVELADELLKQLES